MRLILLCLFVFGCNENSEKFYQSTARIPNYLIKEVEQLPKNSILIQTGNYTGEAKATKIIFSNHDCKIQKGEYATDSDSIQLKYGDAKDCKKLDIAKMKELEKIIINAKPDKKTHSVVDGYFFDLVIKTKMHATFYDLGNSIQNISPNRKKDRIKIEQLLSEYSIADYAKNSE